MKNSLKILLYVLLIISVVIAVAFYLMNKGDKDETMVSPMLNWAYILFGVGVLLAIVLPIVFTSGRGGKKTLIGIGIFVLALVVSFLLASGNEVPVSQSVEKPSSTILKLTDTALIMSIILLAAAIVVTIVGSVIRRKS